MISKKSSDEGGDCGSSKFGSFDLSSGLREHRRYRLANARCTISAQYRRKRGIAFVLGPSTMTSGVGSKRSHKKIYLSYHIKLRFTLATLRSPSGAPPPTCEVPAVFDRRSPPIRIPSREGPPTPEQTVVATPRTCVWADSRGSFLSRGQAQAHADRSVVAGAVSSALRQMRLDGEGKRMRSRMPPGARIFDGQLRSRPSPTESILTSR